MRMTWMLFWRREKVTNNIPLTLRLICTVQYITGLSFLLCFIHVTFHCYYISDIMIKWISLKGSKIWEYCFHLWILFLFTYRLPNRKYGNITNINFCFVARRHMAETKQNDRSSRSHCILRVVRTPLSS